MIALNRTREKILGNLVERAETFLSRARGLLWRKSLPAGGGLWIAPCRSVHTFGMSFPIDVLFLDKDGRVLGLHPRLPSGRVTRYYPKAAGALELPAGVIGLTDTVRGDLVEFLEEG